MNCEPLFTTVELFPDDINKRTDELRIMSDSEFKGYVETIRQHFIKIHKEKHPVFATSRTKNEIIEDLKSFNNIMSTGINDDNINIITHKLGKSKISVQWKLPEDKDIDTSLLLSYNTRYSNAINHWFPEIWDTKISSGKAVTDQFYDEEQFYKNVRDIIKKDRFKLFNAHKSGGQYISDFLIQCLRIVSGNQPVYNFPSTLAKWIYLDKAKRLDKDQEDYYISDMSAGWSGRMLAAISASNDILLKDINTHYYATDPNIAVHDRFAMIDRFWRENIIDNKKFYFYKSTLPAEDIFNDPIFNNTKGKFDLHFTSPPYFNKERYSNDKGQSYITYKEDYDLWKEGFLKKMIQNTYDLLKVGGESWINIADVKDKGKNYHSLESDTIKYAIECGFEHIKTYKMQFGIMPGNDKRSEEKKIIDNAAGKNKVKNKNTGGDNPEVHNSFEYAGKKYKFEPIFVFKK